MSPIIPSRYGHPKYNSFPQKSRATSLGGIKGISQRGTPGSDSKSRRKQRLEENKITVQPTEDEEADNFFSKHLAAARFQRNHRLINILFSDVVVDHDQNAENEKVQFCRQKRIKNLEEIRDKANKEIIELEEKYVAKRAKIIDDGRKFNDNLRDYVEKSKREISALKVAQDIRRQKEMLIRQQAPKPILTPTPAPNLDNTIVSSAEIKVGTPSAQAAMTTTPSTEPSTTHANNTGDSEAVNKSHSTNHNGITPMEVESDSVTLDKSDVQFILNDLLSSVAKAV